NPDHRKYHYLLIIFSYGISYLITQIVLYGRIDSDEIIPIDILSVNTFFLLMWLLGQMSIWNFLFLRRALPLTKQELGEEEPELLFFTIIEFNNRNALFVSGNWEISQTQYVIEWITLLLLMLIIIAYILTTLTNFLRDKFYYLQLFMVSILFFKLLTEFMNIMV